MKAKAIFNDNWMAIYILLYLKLDSVSRYSFIFFIGAILFINAVYFDLLVKILSSISVPINIGGKTAANLGSHRPLAAPIALRVSGTVFLDF